MEYHSNIQKYPAITGVSKSSFANFTISQRLPVILERLIDDLQENAFVVSRLQSLRENIIYGKIEHFPVIGLDIIDWQKYIKPFLGMTWFDVPFYFAETYFYRMILDAVDFFISGIDPFGRQKQREIESHQAHMMQLANEMEFDKGEDVAHILGRLIELSLWGNKADLSQLETSNKRRDDNQTIVDDSKRLIEYLEKGVHRIDIVLDNSGLELFTDILFASWMISLGLSEKIVLHSKAYPTFVSDATAKDVENLSKSLTNQYIEFSELFLKYQEHGQIQILEHEFWNSPLHFFEMPEEMHDELKHSELIVFKGDANYRRIFGDRHIPTTISSNLLADYLPARSIAIRILKSEIMVGLTDLQFQELNQNHSDWMISGKFGIVQLLN